MPAGTYQPMYGKRFCDGVLTLGSPMGAEATTIDDRYRLYIPAEYQDRLEPGDRFDIYVDTAGQIIGEPIDECHD